MRKYKIENKKVCILESYDGSALFIASYIMQLLLQATFSVILVVTKVDVEFTSSFAGICILSVLNELAMLLTPFVYSKIKGENLFKAAGFNKGFNLLQSIALVLTGFVMVMAFAPIANGFVKLVELSGYDLTRHTALQITNWTELVVGLLVLAIFAPICEEFLYRGMISRAFGDMGVICGIFLSAFFFTIMHGNPVQLVHQFGVGVVCATAFLLTRSIWSGVIIHVTNNCIAIIGNFYLYKTNNLTYQAPIWLSIILCIVGCAALFGLFILLYVGSKKKRGDKEDKLPLFKGMAHQMQYMLHTAEEREVFEYEKNIRLQQMQDCDSEEMHEVMESALKEQKGKIDKRSKNALIYAIILGMAVWLINTITGYIG